MSRNRTTRPAPQAAPEAAALVEAAPAAPTLAQAEAAHPAPSTRQDAIKAALAAAQAAEEAATAAKAAKAAKASAKAAKAARGPTLIDDAKAILAEAGRDLPVGALVEALRALRPTVGQDAKAAKAAEAEATAAELIAASSTDPVESAAATERATLLRAEAAEARIRQARQSIGAALYTAAKHGALALVARGTIGLAKAA